METIIIVLHEEYYNPNLSLIFSYFILFLYLNYMKYYNSIKL